MTWSRLAAAALVGAVALGCGASRPPQPPGSIKVAMTEYRFEPKDIAAPPGRVVLYLVNDGSLSHDLVIKTATGRVIAKSEVVSGGGAAVMTVGDLAPGTYVVACDLPGHTESGMTGTLNVT